MYFVQFYQDPEGKIEGVGDRSVLIVDGLLNEYKINDIANDWGIKHGHAAFKLYQGESFTRARAKSRLHKV
ncbi:hypothetical protein RZS08_60455, partial [Arthrospira platensis SPKY1]|nr:hypothetical protein [Arthrospira platensis SPKY1]